MFELICFIEVVNDVRVQFCNTQIHHDGKSVFVTVTRSIFWMPAALALAWDLLRGWVVVHAGNELATAESDVS
jgi:hypothetical protein